MAERLASDSWDPPGRPILTLSWLPSHSDLEALHGVLLARLPACFLAPQPCPGCLPSVSVLFPNGFPKCCLCPPYLSLSIFFRLDETTLKLSDVDTFLYFFLISTPYILPFKAKMACCCVPLPNLIYNIPSVLAMMTLDFVPNHCCTLYTASCG